MHRSHHNELLPEGCVSALQTVRLNFEHSFRCFTLSADRGARCQHCRRKGQRWQWPVHNYLVHNYLVHTYLVHNYLVHNYYLVHTHLVHNYLEWCVYFTPACLQTLATSLSAEPPPVWMKEAAGDQDLSDSTLLCLLCRLLTMELTMEVPLTTRIHCLIAIGINATCLRRTRSLAGRMTRQGE